MVFGNFAPKQPRWLAATALTGSVAIVSYAATRWLGPWAPGHPPGLVFGTLAACIVFASTLYPLRRRLIGWPFASAGDWLQFHIYGGSLAFLFAAVHVGFRWPVGRLGWSIVLIGAWSVGSGLAGVFLQKLIPARLTEELSVEALYERLPELAERLCIEADRLMAGAPDSLDRLYRAEIRPALSTLRPSSAYLIEIQRERSRRLARLREIAPFVPESERARLDDLAVIVAEKLELDVHFSLQRILRQWVTLHAPVAYVLAALVAIHIALVWSF